MLRWRVVKGMRIKLSSKYAIIIIIVAILTIVNINLVSAQQNTSAAQISIPIRNLEGLVYVDLPKNLCQEYTASSVDNNLSISTCGRGNSYFLMVDKLVGRLANGRAIDKVMNIREFPQRLKDKELFISAGCAFKKDIRYGSNGIPTSFSSKDNIYAVVKDLGTQPYKIVNAYKFNWDTNGNNARFAALKSQDVACYSPGWLAGE